ncbi:PTS mannitol transporter subunit IIBC [Gracilibacillus salitolerans]|uniref:PTS system mannitol-specific EIICB component n=1 Tax=Gracilibacillus salitolerans TaxID=2663022 RepID=A0A5Q2TTW3_9BACI|nr:PTS mannitol transporter subunit IICB [Gracilibacillus salitolerans]QGH36228.1 PTS mannitol transporter subunit IIBC [Gracilibacillus salitolerans]
MSLRAKTQAFGSKLSSMVLPNLGAFMAWGILTAIGIAFEIDLLQSFISPMLTYLLTLLIAFAGGRMVHGYRGSVIAAIATMGIIIGAEITMFIGAMIMGPLAAWILKKFDALVEKKIPTGFELLVNNLSSGIIGATLAVVGNVAFAPAIESLTGVLAAGVEFLMSNGLLPLTAIFIEPAKILFLNNAIGQGVLTPLGFTQIEELGKSIMFILESNPGPGLGILLAYMIFGRGNSKGTAYGASVIHLFGGIHEIYFPFVLMNPILILPLILGGMTGTLIFTLFDIGLVGVASPGSIISISIMSAVGDHLPIYLGILASAAVTFFVSIPFLKRAKNNGDQLQTAATQMENLKGKKSKVSSVFENNSNEESTFDFSNVSKIAYACDAGLGSSAMGASVLQKKIEKAGFEGIQVFHLSVSDLPIECDIVITHKSLMDRVKEKQPNAHHIAIEDYLNAPEYEELVTNLKGSKK